MNPPFQSFFDRKAWECHRLHKHELAWRTPISVRRTGVQKVIRLARQDLFVHIDSVLSDRFFLVLQCLILVKIFGTRVHENTIKWKRIAQQRIKAKRNNQSKCGQQIRNATWISHPLKKSYAEKLDKSEKSERGIESSGPGVFTFQDPRRSVGESEDSDWYAPRILRRRRLQRTLWMTPCVLEDEERHLSLLLHSYGETRTWRGSYRGISESRLSAPGVMVLCLIETHWSSHEDYKISDGRACSSHEYKSLSEFQRLSWPSTVI